jgi:hypothetical protein
MDNQMNVSLVKILRTNGFTTPEINIVINSGIDKSLNMMQLWAQWHAVHGRSDKEYMCEKLRELSELKQLYILELIHRFDNIYNYVEED